ncbi:hypothetical protein [Streptomyces katsurahamanus]|uniref:Uncharacterized protein n=1 Tax=Streptomyces katsurahamanus TaxID=2577098 RepID=A0ABW9NLW4_9ACTN|nr:hypothetical protein [Streptomyces katsurahamanus]MQS34136.1 hypothetical protein [Streptomyces katsurahamanus]
MNAPFPKVMAFAAAASIAPWAVGGLLSYFLPYPSGPSIGDRWQLFVDDAFSDVAWTFVPLTILATIAVTLVRPSRTWWAAATRSTVAYSVVLLAVSIASAVVSGTEGAVDYGFVRLTFALLTLQIPLCFLLSALLARRLLGLASEPDGRRHPVGPAH